MLKAVWIIFFSVFMLSGCSEKSSNLKTGFLPDDNKLYKDTFSIRGKTIPLPPGDWKIVASGFDSEKFFNLYLIQEHAGKLFSAVFVSVDSLELDREGGYIPNEEIKRLDLHYKVLNKNTNGEAQDWWFVNNTTTTFTPKEGNRVLNDMSVYIKSHNYIISNDYIYVVHKLTGAKPYRKRNLHVEYIYNPEAAGFSPGPKGEWRTSDWNAMRVNEDSRKVEYIKELVKEHTLIHEKIKAGFHPK